MWYIIYKIKEREVNKMTIKELIIQLKILTENGVDENAKVINAEQDDIYSVIVTEEEDVLIYF